MGTTGLNQYDLQNSDVILLEFIDPVESEEETPPVSIPVNLTITSGATSLYDGEISVIACDSDNNPETPDTITAYCAILQSGLSSDWNWTWAPGAFVNSIEDIVGYTSQDSLGNDVYHYWSWSLNGEMGTTGLNQYDLQNSDVILLEFIDPVESEEEVSNTGGGGGSGSSLSFSVSNAISFLSSHQNLDGSFFNDMYTDWVAIAASSSSEYGNELKSKIYNYIINNEFESSVITDYERHVMALMSLGINPYNGTSVDYIKKITEAFDGEQIGNPLLFNDDIFGVLVLRKAGYSKDDDIILKSVEFIINNQSNSGSFGSIDMTSAFVQSTKDFEDVSGLDEAIEKAENYLKQNQESDGGFGNSYSTSWVIQAFSMSNDYSSEISNAKKYLAENQESDGGVGESSSDLSSRIWATSYAIPASLHLSWNEILESFDKQEEIVNELESEVIEELKGQIDIEIPILEQEQIKIIEKPVVLNTIKLEKKFANIEIVKPLMEEKINNNLLSANALGSIEGNELSDSLINRILNIIKGPFVWLWIVLGF
jgi:hypothetical protein